jgi:hypothetical protein
VGETGPYVSVGHSFCRDEAINPPPSCSEISGLVLIDTSPVTWLTPICTVPNDDTTAANTL